MISKEDIEEMTRLMEQATITAQNHTIAMRRALKKYKEMRDSMEGQTEPVKEPAVMQFPPTKASPVHAPHTQASQPMTTERTIAPMVKQDPEPEEEADFDMSVLPTNDQILESLITSKMLQNPEHEANARNMLREKKG